jgi:hypothetical protein
VDLGGLVGGAELGEESVGLWEAVERAGRSEAEDATRAEEGKGGGFGGFADWEGQERGGRVGRECEEIACAAAERV